MPDGLHHEHEVHVLVEIYVVMNQDRIEYVKSLVLYQFNVTSMCMD